MNPMVFASTFLDLKTYFFLGESTLYEKIPACRWYFWRLFSHVSANIGFAIFKSCSKTLICNSKNKGFCACSTLSQNRCFLKLRKYPQCFIWIREHRCNFSAFAADRPSVICIKSSSQIRLISLSVLYYKNISLVQRFSGFALKNEALFGPRIAIS